MKGFLYTTHWRCLVCSHEQTRGYDKKARPSDHFEGGKTVHRAMLCKGTCRRLPRTVVEENAVNDHSKSILVNGFIGAVDGMVPQTTNHLLIKTKLNRVEKKRRKVAG